MTWLTLQVGDYLSLEAGDVQPDMPLAQYGLNSVYALGLCGDIEDEFGITVEPTLAWDYPTIELVAEFIDEQLVGDRS